MEQQTMFLFTRTPLHVGAGESVGYLDRPIRREPHTRIPIIPGSTLKGVLRNREEWTEADRDWLFGSLSGQSGALSIGEARVLAFPVRSAKGSFAWITCPMVLKRFIRDTDTAVTLNELSIDESLLEALGGDKVTLKNDKIVLEEYAFARRQDSRDYLAVIEPLLVDILPDDPVWQELPGRLVIVANGQYSYFVQHACEISQHIEVDDATGVARDNSSRNQENVPSETMFHGMIGAHDGNGKAASAALRTLAPLHLNVLQIGANESTGLGWCTWIYPLAEGGEYGISKP